jgi:hypothetical protein
LDGIDKSRYNFTFKTPFSIYIMGNPLTSNDISLNNLSVAISNISASVNYSGTKIPNQNIGVTYSTSEVTNMNFNIIDSNTQYGAYLYSGILTLSNIDLNTSPGFTYDIYLQCNMNFTDPNKSTISKAYNNYYTTSKSGIFCNLSAFNIKNTYNTNLNTSNSTTMYKKYSINGV